MKKQVILDLMDELEKEKRTARRLFKETPSKISRGHYEGMWSGLELAIRKCLKVAGIIDLRPHNLKHF